MPVRGDQGAGVKGGVCAEAVGRYYPRPLGNYKNLAVNRRWLLFAANTTKLGLAGLNVKSVIGSVMQQYSIPEILTKIAAGQIRIPRFQRGFVWEPDRVAYLMDSIYKGYPVGSLLLWRTGEQLKDERNLGPFTLPKPEDKFPIDYVLDGQQRLTSIFAVFQSSLESDGSIDWMDIYYDLSAHENPQETQFVALDVNKVEQDKHIPLDSFFNTKKYAPLFKSVSDELGERIEKVREKFQTAQIPYEMTETKDKSTVAIIFERVNRQGVELDTFQLLTAWTWSEDFELQEQFDQLSGEVRPYGFGDIGDDTNLLLRCCSAILVGDASPKALMNINGEDFRVNFDRITSGIKSAIDFLKSNLKMEQISNLPFSTLIVPLCVYFAALANKEAVLSDDHRDRIIRWFWRSSFSRRYSSGVLRNLKTDIEEMALLREGKASKIGEFGIQISDEFFTKTTFGIGNVNSKTFILMIAQSDPRTFISGQPIDLALKLKSANRAEFHHLMPRKFLRDSQQTLQSESLLANFAFVTRSENRELGGKAPSLYKDQMKGDTAEILRRSLIPDSLFNDKYDAFLIDRAAILAKRARDLCGI